MPRATCSTGLPLPGSPHFKLNKVKQVKKPRQLPAVTGCEQPWRFLFGSLSCYLLLSWDKSPVQGQTSPPDRWFSSSKESNQQFSKHTKSAFVSIWISQPKKIQSVPLPGFRSIHCSCREEVPVQVEQVFPNSQHPIPAGALAAGSRTHIKTSKHRLYVATSGFSRATRPAPAADTVRKSPSPALGTAAMGETEPGSSELTFTQVCCLLQGFECSPPTEKLQTPKWLEIHIRDGFWCPISSHTHPKGSSHSTWMQFKFKHSISD